MATDARTDNQNLPKPHTDNYMSEDMARLIETIDAIDALITSILSSVAGKADLSHTQAIATITGLQAALDAKAAQAHLHALGDLSNVDLTEAAPGQVLMLGASNWQPSAVPAGDWSTITSKPSDLDGFGLTAEVQALIDALGTSILNAPPAALDTLNELAAALGDDPNFAATMTAALAAKADAAATTAALALKAAAAIQIIAGTGLTGGGTLAVNRTLNVDVGTTANKIVQLDGSARLPAVDGSQLTGLSAGGWILHDSDDLPAAANVTIGSIPAGANHILLVMANVSNSAGVSSYKVEFQIGDSGGVETTGYLEGTNNRSYFAGNIFTTGGQASAVGAAFLHMSRIPGTNLWADLSQGTCCKELSGELTQVNAYWTGGAFDAGKYALYYQ